jgi:hypothetical protein
MGTTSQHLLYCLNRLAHMLPSHILTDRVIAKSHAQMRLPLMLTSPIGDNTTNTNRTETTINKNMYFDLSFFGFFLCCISLGFSSLLSWKQKPKRTKQGQDFLISSFCLCMCCVVPDTQDWFSQDDGVHSSVAYIRTTQLANLLPSVILAYQYELSQITFA